MNRREHLVRECRDLMLTEAVAASQQLRERAAAAQLHRERHLLSLLVDERCERARASRTDELRVRNGRA
eukprot:1160489-Prymnesium_polylepis.1